MLGAPVDGTDHAKFEEVDGATSVIVHQARVRRLGQDAHAALGNDVELAPIVILRGSDGALGPADLAGSFADFAEIVDQGVTETGVAVVRVGLGKVELFYLDFAGVGDAHAGQEALIPCGSGHGGGQEAGRCASDEVDVWIEDGLEVLFGGATALGVKVAVVEVGQGVHEIAVIAREQGAKLGRGDEETVVVLDPSGVDLAGRLREAVDQCGFGKGDLGDMVALKGIPKAPAGHQGPRFAGPWWADEEDVDVRVDVLALGPQPYFTLHSPGHRGDSCPPPMDQR